MQILTVAIQKGGTGKSTTATALAQAAAFKGKKVLVIDLDPQGNTSFSLGAKMSDTANSYTLLSGMNALDAIQHSPQGLDVICSSWNLSTITSSKGSARRLQEALKPLKLRYDWIVIDTPPTPGELQYNALQASTGLIIPLSADIYSLQALYQIIDTAKQFQKSNSKLILKGYLITQYDARASVYKKMKASIDEQAAAMGLPSLGIVRKAVAIQEAAAFQTSLYEYAPSSKPAEDYMAIYELLNQE